MSQGINGDPAYRIFLLLTARSYRGEAFTQAAARLNIEVIPVVDMAAELAGYWRYPLGVDFGQPEAAVQAMVEYAARRPVNAVLAVDDSGVVLAAAAARRLGLPHNAPEAAQAARDKFLMRSAMAAGGAACPTFRRFTFAQDPAEVARQVSYPCVIKPLNLNGSRGVMRADTPAELAAAVERLARLLAQEPPGAIGDAYLVEDFIPGVEVALEGIMDGGRLTVLALFDKPDPLDGPFFEETIYVTPSRLPEETQRAIADCAERAARAIGLQMGPVHAELRVNEQGPWMLEVAGRSIGGLCGQTLRFDAGQSLEELILRQAVGLPLGSTRRAGRASGVMMIPIPEAGILTRVEGVEAARATPGVEEVTITAKLHYPLTPLPEGDSYLGFIFARGETPAAVEETLRAAHACLRFTVTPEFALYLG
ncbi:MAG TPA: ATP-grasp domain-containing protein [Caldilineaceae bacterium]|nr:ATP-grasp domain-containing protein [Caldilineaceae bacterium]